jgi:hypothetical protein
MGRYFTFSSLEGECFFKADNNNPVREAGFVSGAVAGE